MSVNYGVIVNKMAVQEFLQAFGWVSEKAEFYSEKKQKNVTLVHYKDPVTGELQLPHEAMQMQMYRLALSRKASNDGG